MLDLPRCSAAAARAATDLALRLPLYATVAGLSLRLSMPGAERPKTGTDWHRLHARLADAAFAVALHPGLLPAEAAARLADLATGALPGELRAILLAVLLREVDDLVEQRLGARPDWAPPGTAAAEPANLLVVARAEAPERAVALLWLDDTLLAHAAEWCRDRPVHHAHIDDVSAVLDLLIDHAPVAAGELRAIRPGDVVLLGRTPADLEQLDLILRVRGGQQFRASLDSGRLHLLSVLDATMDPPEPGPSPWFDDIQLSVEFGIGRLTLSLSRLRELAVGQVLDLGFDATTAVTLRVNGQVIAVGELVRIAERAGVRITELRLERGVVTGMPSPLTLLVLLVAVAVIPFVAIMATTYVKLVVVLGLVRNALGVQNVPPNMALNGIAIVLSVYIMLPVARNAYDAVRDRPLSFNNLEEIGDLAGAGAAPFRTFLEQHTKPTDRSFFVEATRRLWPPDQAATVTEHDFFVLVPAFTTAELTSAFRIGFLLFLPFVVVDLIISNILLAMGMMMVSPMTISLPFKLFLFVLVNGWQELIHGLVLSYAGAK